MNDGKIIYKLLMLVCAGGSYLNFVGGALRGKMKRCGIFMEGDKVGGLGGVIPQGKELDRYCQEYDRLRALRRWAFLFSNRDAGWRFENGWLACQWWGIPFAAKWKKRESVPAAFGPTGPDGANSATALFLPQRRQFQRLEGVELRMCLT